jgi:hypothetical protein
MELPGGKRRALHRRLESVVVAVGAAALDVGDPAQYRALRRTVVDTPGPRQDEHVFEPVLERLVLPLAEAGTDPLDETAGVAVFAGVDGGRDPFA